MVADTEGMDRLGLDPASVIGVHVSECGFEPYERDDGLHPAGSYSPDPADDRYLRGAGFDADNPWEHWANSGQAADRGCGAGRCRTAGCWPMPTSPHGWPRRIPKRPA